MTALSRRVAPLLLIAFGAVVAACGSTVSPRPASLAPTAATVSIAASLTPVPGAPSPTPAATLPPTSKPEFGAIWDALPKSWPKLPGQTESEVGSDASSMLIVNGQPAALARQLEASLTDAGWTVDVGSPLEDGSVVLDGTGPADGCRAEVRLTPDQPGGDTVTLLVYYGAGCPFD